MYVDARLSRRGKEIRLITDSGDNVSDTAVKPYFYIIERPDKIMAVRSLLDLESVELEETDYTPIIYKEFRYDVDRRYRVYRVYVDNPSRIPEIASVLYKSNIRVSASNLRYIIRNTFDKDVVFFDSEPLYYAFDSEMMKKISNVKILVFDVEVIKNAPAVVSSYWLRPLEDVDPDDVQIFELPGDLEALERTMSEAKVIAGHNIVGFDIPVLKHAGVLLDVQEKSVFDSSVFLSVHGNAVGVGASRTLYDVAKILREDAKITARELEIKREVHGNVERLSREKLYEYNRNDVVITSKLLNLFYPFVAVVSGLTQIPVSEVIRLRSGKIAEYFLLHLLELEGFVPEYREVKPKITAKRVWLEKENAVYDNVLQTDVNMMYPSFVLHNYIDPTLRDRQGGFDRKNGLGVFYSAVLRLVTVRRLTKKLKKQDKLYEPLDKGVKAIVNAFSYGVQGKKSSLAIVGNPWCPEAIFYGTKEAQFGVIKHLRSKGIRVVYSDTDSFFIVLSPEEIRDENKIRSIVNEINNYLSRYGLAVDVEGVWDKMLIYSKKNYMLYKGDRVIIRGSALLNLERRYTVEAVDIREILTTTDKKERRKIVYEQIMSAPLEELVIRSHQQFWRLLGKDYQDLKRQSDRQGRYLTVRTPWPDKSVITLKKVEGGQLLQPYNAPLLLKLGLGGGVVVLEDENPFAIVEINYLPVDKTIRPAIVGPSNVDALVFLDGWYGLRFGKIYYIIKTTDKIWRVPSKYSGRFPSRPVGVIERVEGSVSLKPVKINEDIFRNKVYEATLEQLSTYGIV